MFKDNPDTSQPPSPFMPPRVAQPPPQFFQPQPSSVATPPPVRNLSPMIKFLIKAVLFIAILLVIIFILKLFFPSGNVPAGTGEATSTIAHWADVRAADRAQVSADWGEPQWVNINTAGWEDGPYIAADGQALYYAYINIDLLKQPQQVVIGPNLDTKNICRPNCGQFPRADMFYAVRSGSAYGAPQPHPLTVAYPIGGLTLVGENRAYFHLEKTDGNRTDLYYADRINGQWQAPVRLDAVSSAYSDDDPYVSPADDEIYFWSERPDRLAAKNIYLAKKVNGVWQAPQLLPEPINSNAGDMQPFLQGDTLYFTSDRDGKPKIYSSKKTGNNWSQPQVVVASQYAVGEPTLTADGQYLYFIQLYRDSAGVNNPDIMWVKKK